MSICARELQCFTAWLLACVALQSLANSKREASLDGRLRAITETLTGDVYSYTCLGLFERQKLMFSFQMAIKIIEAGPAPLDPQVSLNLGFGLHMQQSFSLLWCMLSHFHSFQASRLLLAADPHVCCVLCVHAVPGLLLEGESVAREASAPEAT